LVGTTGRRECKHSVAVDFCLNEHGDADAVMEIMVGIRWVLWARAGSRSAALLDEALARSSGVTVSARARTTAQ